MRGRFTTVAVAALVLLSGCGSHSASSRSKSATTGGSEGSGVLASEPRNVANFTQIDLAGTSKVIVRVGAPKEVVVHGDDNLLRLITTKVTGHTLVVAESGSFNSHRGIEVDVAIPSLAGVTLSGTGDLIATDVRAARFKVNLAGAGRLEVSGSAKHLDASLTGVGDARLGHLLTSDTHVVVSGTGSATVFARKSLNASVSGTGQVVYLGNPQHTKMSITGTGVVRRG